MTAAARVSGWSCHALKITMFTIVDKHSRGVLTMVNVNHFGDRIDHSRSQGGASMARTERHIVANPDGGWDVVKPHAQRSSSHHETQSGAIDRAREIVQNAGGGEVITHGRDGRIRDSD